MNYQGYKTCKYCLKEKLVWLNSVEYGWKLLEKHLIDGETYYKLHKCSEKKKDHKKPVKRNSPDKNLMKTSQGFVEEKGLDNLKMCMVKSGKLKTRIWVSNPVINTSIQIRDSDDPKRIWKVIEIEE